MGPDERAYVVGIAEEVFGSAQRRHRWPFLVDGDGDRLEVDAWWPEHRIAFVLVPGGHDDEEWQIASATLGARGIRILIAATTALPSDDAGALVRDPSRVRTALLGAGFPGSREMFEMLTQTDVGSWSTFVVGADDLAGPWYGDEPPAPGWPTDGGDGPTWSGPETEPEERPWLPDWRFEDHEDDWDVDGHDVGDEPRAWDDASRIDLGWRSRPMALAALGAVALTRRVLADEVLDGQDGTAVLVLVALAVPENDAATQEQAGPRGLSARLGLGERTVRGALAELSRDGLVEADEHTEPRSHTLTAAGRDVVTAWLRRIAPLFAGWPPTAPDVDDAT